MAEDKKDVKATDEAQDAPEPVSQVSDSPNLRAMAEAEYRRPTPLEVAQQYEDARVKKNFEPQMVPAGVPASLMPATDVAGTPAAPAATTTAGAADTAASTTTTTVDAPEATPGETTTTTARRAGGGTR